LTPSASVAAADLPTPGLLPRRVAWEVLQAVAAGAYADVALERALRKHSMSAADRGLVTELTYGAIRQRQCLDGWLDRLGKVPASKQPPLLRWLLHLGLYQILRMDRIPAAAAVNTAVELVKSSKLARLAPVVNGILRAALRARDAGELLPLPQDSAARLAQAESLPLWLIEQLFAWRGEEAAQAFARASNQVPPLDLRINRLRASRESVQQALAAIGVESNPIESCPDGLFVVGSAGDLCQWPGYKEGHWCVQDRTAQLVAPLLDPQPGDRILDACAAPGGKASHLVELIGGRGDVWAVDRSAGRLKRLAANADRLGVDCLNALAADATDLLALKPDWHGAFQRILVDAPCSGLGTLARHADARWRITPLQVEELVILQAKLLEGLLPLLSPGGRMVYATCTIHPAENCDQIQAFLCRHPELSLSDQQQIWPDPEHGGDGFYTAVLDLS
jgi:16S rRNA (cytosine967-C5)-methyltransferase|tara:strand:+ start:2869 stop:4218 length:1350 start_codon:yes stop_codon:yes gene_type:complete